MGATAPDWNATFDDRGDDPETSPRRDGADRRQPIPGGPRSADVPTRTPMPEAAAVPRRATRGVDVLVLLTFDGLALAFARLVGPSWPPLTYLYVAGALLVMWLGHEYQPKISRRLLDETPRLLMHLAVPLLLVASLAQITTVGTPLLRAASFIAVAMYTARGLAYATIRHVRRSGRAAERTILVGSGEVARELAEQIADHPEYGLRPVGFVDGGSRGGEELPLPRLGSIERLDDLVQDVEAEHVLVAFGQCREAQMVSVLRTAVLNDVSVHVVPRFFDLGLPVSIGAADDIGGIPLLPVQRSALRRSSWRVKRATDIAVAGLALFVTAPLMLGLALAVAATSRGPVLFRQVRIGQHGRPFHLLKFRSMPQDHSGDTTWNVTAAASTPTPVGRWLRATSLDELPQLWNVLRGDMSLVGPRPERPHFADQFSARIPGYSDRHRLPVGLTGWSQVNGLRQDTSIMQRARFDNYYIERWSLWFDVRILLRTVGVVAKDFAGAVRR